MKVRLVSLPVIATLILVALCVAEPQVSDGSLTDAQLSAAIDTAESWIETEAVKAKREMLPFGLADVTPDMRLPYIRVLALPSTADYITGAGLSMASSVHRVVLSVRTRSETVQPLEASTGIVEGNSAYRSVNYTSAGAVFSVAAKL